MRAQVQLQASLLTVETMVVKDRHSYSKRKSHCLHWSPPETSSTGPSAPTELILLVSRRWPSNCPTKRQSHTQPSPRYRALCGVIVSRRVRAGSKQPRDRKALRRRLRRTSRIDTRWLRRSYRCYHLRQKRRCWSWKVTCLVPPLITKRKVEV